MGRSNRLRLYVDLMSQPSRAVLIFCRVNNIDAELATVNLAKGENRKPEFKAVNPLGKVPAINDSGFKLAESHAIMEYLVSTRPGIADHWYPNDAQRRAEINSVLDWHHANLRRGSSTLVFHRVLAPGLGIESDPRAAAEGESMLTHSLKIIDRVLLQEGYPFLAAGKQPSIADLSLVCELKQLEMLEKSERMALLSPYKRTTEWISAVETSTDPHFSEVHRLLYKAAQRAQERRDANCNTQENSGGDKIAGHKVVSKL